MAQRYGWRPTFTVLGLVGIAYGLSCSLLFPKIALRLPRLPFGSFPPYSGVQSEGFYFSGPGFRCYLGRELAHLYSASFISGGALSFVTH
jgi:hypothetical protein